VVEVQGVSAHGFDLSGEAEVDRKNDDFGTELRDGGVCQTECVELFSLDEFFCGTEDLDSAADEFLQCVDQFFSSPSRRLIEKVAGLGEDVRRGDELLVGLKERLKQVDVLIGERLNPFEPLQEHRICSRDKPEQEEIRIE
jgi:hypothetical protein